jgi:peptidoglycan/xylan/chitin deacetylase (PgdA/CDA1 family)
VPTRAAGAGFIESILEPFYDAFNRADGGLGNLWLASTWTISGRAALCTPTISPTEIVSNGDMEIGDPPTGWTPAHANVAANAMGPHGGLQDLSVTSTAANAFAWQTVTLQVQRWYQAQLWAHCNIGGSWRAYVLDATDSHAIFDTLGRLEATYINYFGIDFTTHANHTFRVYEQLGDGHIVYADDLSIRELTPSSFFALQDWHCTNLAAKINVNMFGYGRAWAGVVLNADALTNPQNCVLGVVSPADGSALVGKARITKCVNGIWSNALTETTVTYVHNAPIELRQVAETTYRLFYNGVQVGTDTTIADPSIIHNTVGGLFASSVNHYLTGFSVRPSTQTARTAAPGVLLTFDDGNASVYTVAYDYMKTKGLVGTAYVISDTVAAGTEATLAQLQEMAAGGWSIANHTQTHQDLSAMTAGEIVTELTNCRDALNGWGLNAARHVAYPIGRYNATVLTAMAQADMLTGRITSVGSIDPVALPTYMLNVYPVDDTTSLATVKGWVTAGLNLGRVVGLLFHNLGNANQMSIANFRLLCDWLATSGYKSYTIDELHRTAF